MKLTMTNQEILFNLASNARFIKEVDRSRITLEMAIMAVKRNRRTFKYIPEELYNDCLLAIDAMSQYELKFKPKLPANIHKYLNIHSIHLNEKSKEILSKITI